MCIRKAKQEELIADLQKQQRGRQQEPFPNDFTLSFLHFSSPATFSTLFPCLPVGASIALPFSPSFFLHLTPVFLLSPARSFFLSLTSLPCSVLTFAFFVFFGFSTHFHLLSLLLCTVAFSFCPFLPTLDSRTPDFQRHTRSFWPTAFPVQM